MGTLKWYLQCGLSVSSCWVLQQMKVQVWSLLNVSKVSATLRQQNGRAQARH